MLLICIALRPHSRGFGYRYSIMSSLCYRTIMDVGLLTTFLILLGVNRCLHISSLTLLIDLSIQEKQIASSTD